MRSSRGVYVDVAKRAEKVSYRRILPSLIDLYVGASCADMTGFSVLLARVACSASAWLYPLLQAVHRRPVNSSLGAEQCGHGGNGFRAPPCLLPAALSGDCSFIVAAARSKGLCWQLRIVRVRNLGAPVLRFMTGEPLRSSTGL